MAGLWWLLLAGLRYGVFAVEGVDPMFQKRGMGHAGACASPGMPNMLSYSIGAICCEGECDGCAGDYQFRGDFSDLHPVG